MIACLLAIAVSGCAQNGTQGGLFAGGSSRPKSVVVSDFVAAQELPAIDRGFSTRMERHGGNYPILERKERTLGRVNDEIVATIITVVREGGLEAQPGNEASLTFNDNVLLVAGRLRATDRKPAAQTGFGPGRGAVSADMTLSRFSIGGKEQVLTFTADAQSGRRPPALPAQAAAARNAEIAAALAAENAAPEKLSPDVEAQARSLGRAIGEKIVAYAKEHDWLEAPQVAAAPEPAAEQRVRLPDAKPAAKPAAAKKPAVESPQAPEDEEPPDTGPPPGGR